MSRLPLPKKSKTAQPVTWNAADYAAHSVPQQTWARELIARLKLRGDERILDVGCGDGKVTAEIARAVPRGSVTGIDASQQMIGFAKKTFPPSEISNLKFEIMDARKIKFAPRFDFVFSNAALHWVDDHQAFLRSAASVLKSGGRLVVSCGGKGNAQDVFLALRSELRLKRWREFFRRMPTPYFFYAPGDYEKWLPKFGFKINTLKLAPKDATYAGTDEFAAWLRTTWLPYTQRVPEKVAQASCLCVSGAKEQLTGKMPVPLPSPREEFIAAVTDRYVAKHPPDDENKIHVRMVRLEIDAVKQ
ncbi:MAG: methyltransferase domain-containing protein [Verrucomicrobiota bacterium]|jgi:trans-aconitate methyltransferase